jgi:hypothetical protein
MWANRSPPLAGQQPVVESASKRGSYLGPDHKVIDMKAFYSALVQALKDARKNSLPKTLARDLRLLCLNTQTCR